MGKALILGCGYIGSAVAREFAGRKIDTIAVTRNSETLESLEKIGVLGCQAEIDGDGWHEFADTEVDLVLNCVSSAGGGIDGYRKSYLDGNRSLASWMKKRDFCGRAIYTSSVSVYPDAGGDWVSELDANPDNERGRLILESEALFLTAREAAKLAVLRLGGIYGPGRTIFAKRIREAGDALPGRGDYFLNLIRCEDIVSAICEVAFARKPLAGVFNVVDDEPASKEEIVRWVAEKMNKISPRFTGERDGSSSRRGGSEPANRRVSNAKFRNATAWKPAYPSFREGYADLLNGG